MKKALHPHLELSNVCDTNSGCVSAWSLFYELFSQIWLQVALLLSFSDKLYNIPPSIGALEIDLSQMQQLSNQTSPDKKSCSRYLIKYYYFFETNTRQCLRERLFIEYSSSNSANSTKFILENDKLHIFQIWHFHWKPKNFKHQTGVYRKRKKLPWTLSLSLLSLSLSVSYMLSWSSSW